jgi:predicted lactoylglutathione lyase
MQGRSTATGRRHPRERRPAMPTTIFVNLAVSDLPRSRAFFETLGYSINEGFSDENAVSVVISDTITAMLLTREFFAEFTSKSIIDATTSTEVQLALSAESKEEVDAIHEKALSAGATPAGEQDHGFMYSKSFDDLDGHHWDFVWMDPEAAAGGAPEMTVDEMRAGTTHS